MTKTKEIIRGGLYATTGLIIAFIFAYLFRILLAKNLSVEEYGLFYSIWNFLTFFLFFIYLGLDQAIIYYLVKFNAEKRYDKIKTAIIGTFFFQSFSTLIFVIVIMVTSNYLEVNYFNYPGSSFFLKIMSIFLLSNVIGGLCTSVLYSFQKIKMYSSFFTIQSILYFVLGAILFSVGLTVSVPYWAYLLTSFLLLLLFIPLSLHTVNIFKYNTAEFKPIMLSLFSYGLPVILTAISSRLIIQTDTLMLTKMMALEQVGLYQAALPIATTLTVLSSGVITVLFPLFTELWQKQEKERVELYLHYIYKYLFILTVLLISLLIFFSNDLLVLMFGTNYSSAENALILLLVGIIFSIYSSINLQSLSSFGNPKLVSKIVFTGAIFNIVFNFIFIRLWGISGAALATSLSYLLMSLLSWYYLKKYVAISVGIKKLFGLFLLSALFSTFFFFNQTSGLSLIIFSLIYIFLYILLIFSKRIVSWSEIQMIQELVFKK